MQGTNDCTPERMFRTFWLDLDVDVDRLSLESTSSNPKQAAF